MTTKNTKWPWNIPNGRKKFQMAMKYYKWMWNIPIFHSIALQSLLKSGFWYKNIPTIWQPWSVGGVQWFLEDCGRQRAWFFYSHVRGWKKSILWIFFSLIFFKTDFFFFSHCATVPLSMKKSDWIDFLTEKKFFFWVVEKIFFISFYCASGFGCGVASSMWFYVQSFDSLFDAMLSQLLNR
jgi:hypothetical protein